jgi:hypothetical protein
MKRDALPPYLPRIRPRHWLCLLLVMLVACGGGGGGRDTAGVGTGGTGLKEGNVTGFGSVFIDGVRYDNSQALVQVDDGSGALAAGQLKLGQRVRVLVNGAGQLSTAEILPALLGPVERAPDAQGYLAVMGQWVRFVSRTMPYQNTLSSSTYLDGYTQFTEVAVGDVVEVHGAWVDADSTKGRVLVASRIEKHTAMPARMLLTGTVDEVKPGLRSFTLTTDDGRGVQGNGAAGDVAVGDMVKVWVNAAELSSWSGTTTISAVHWKAANQPTNPGLSGSTLEISGLPVQFRTQDKLVVVQGITARLDVDRLSAATLQALQAGTFSRFTLRQDETTGLWTVDEVTPRDGDSLGRSAAVVFRGIVANVLSGDQIVRLNSVDVDLGGWLAQGDACAKLDPDTTVAIEVSGHPQGSVVQAGSVICRVLPMGVAR